MPHTPSADREASQRRIGRLAATVLIISAVIYAYFGMTIEYAFSSDPIGPRGFPVGLAIALLILGIWYWLHPGLSEEWPEREGRIAAISFLVISAASVLAMDWIGFVPAMLILMTAIARLFGASWTLALVNGVCQALLWWLLFGPLLGGTLPKGPLGF
jgi:putative tricarboxylic transport membrane protein